MEEEEEEEGIQTPCTLSIVLFAGPLECATFSRTW